MTMLETAKPETELTPTVSSPPPSSANGVDWTRFLVFGTCLLFVLSTDIAKVLLAGKLRSRLTPKNMHRIDQVSGLILIGFGIFLLWGVFKYGQQLH